VALWIGRGKREALGKQSRRRRSLCVCKALRVRWQQRHNMLPREPLAAKQGNLFGVVGGWQQSSAHSHTHTHRERCIHRSKKHCDDEDGSRNRVEAKEREPDSDKRGKQGASKYGTTLLLRFFLSFFPFRRYVSLLSLLFISSHTHTLIALSLLFNFPMVIICS
jgi:hypothetical protein